MNTVAEMEHPPALDCRLFAYPHRGPRLAPGFEEQRRAQSADGCTTVAHCSVLRWVDRNTARLTICAESARDGIEVNASVHLSPDQLRGLATLLLNTADDIEQVPAP